MENATKALIIACNVMLAVIILSVLLYGYGRIRQLPLEEDARAQAEAIAEFNKGFEVYDKKIMYGVDVLSCLNKAKSNNEKYITGSFLSGALSSRENAIDVVVALKSPLEESITVKYYEENMASSKVMEQLVDKNLIDTSANFANMKTANFSLQDLYDNQITNQTGTEEASATNNIMALSQKFLLPISRYERIYKNNLNPEVGDSYYNQILVMTQSSTTPGSSLELIDQLDSTFEDPAVSTISVGGENYRVYHLMPVRNKENIADQNNYLKLLLTSIGTFNTSAGQMVYNRYCGTLYHSPGAGAGSPVAGDVWVYNNTNTVYENPNDLNFTKKWSSLEWRPAIIDFKSRKFKCVAINTVYSYDANGFANGIISQTIDTTEPGVVYGDNGAIITLCFQEI